MASTPSNDPAGDFTTIEVARLLGLSVRSVQLMVDRGELEAWKTSGGHRRISGASVDRWRVSRTLSRTVADGPPASQPAGVGPAAGAAPAADAPRAQVLLIDDSTHFQKLVALLVQQRFPHVDLHVADDGIAGLAMCGRIEPEVLIVDIVLPGIDGATLITTLRSHAQFAGSRLAVVTSLDAHERVAYAFALEQIPVIYKPRLVAELSALLTRWLPSQPEHA